MSRSGVEMCGVSVQGQGMSTTPTAAEAEERFRQFLQEHDLPQPDEIIHRNSEICVLYHEPKVVLVVELQDREGEENKSRRPA